MSAKRPAPFAHTHPSRHEQVPDEPRRKRQKPNLPANLGAQSFKKAHTVNDLKSRVRDLTRLLEHHADLPATVRVEKERALQSARHELETEVQAKKRSDMIGRWHKVRFFDRQKGAKRLKRARKELGACVEGTGEGKEGLEGKVRDAEAEVAYAVYYPLDLDYRPLFPTKRKKEGDDAVVEEAKADVQRQGDPVMWETVKRCMTDGTLDALRNGKLAPADGDAVAVEKRVKPAAAAELPKKRKKEKEVGDRHGNRRERRTAARAESENDSEGGFFE
ncbi:hypothetical protein LTR08_003523 [Meristemomyces frigidus]|nr:hypothetical protein LTR08_003523 [Meristemomyces frigidus]